VPPWLATRMAQMGRVLVEALVLHYGRDEVLRRLAHPFWFQSLGCVMGMDWHSSGITTSVLGALKRGLAPVEWELGLHVCGGRGRQSRRTPDELLTLAERTGFDGDRLAHTSRLVAKIDSAAVQDGYQLYLHGFVVTDDGKWTVVQQGMQPELRSARRYHWLGAAVHDFVDEPHAAIAALDGTAGGADVINLTDRRARPSRAAQLQLLASGPDRALQALATTGGLSTKGAASPARQSELSLAAGAPHLALPARHDVRVSDVVMRRLHGTLAAAAARAPVDFADLLMTPGLGARTVEALALAAEIVHGAPCRFTDPARFSFAHGGKDGSPFPVPLRVYDETLRVLRRAVDAARLGNDERLAAIRRLDSEARRLEAAAAGPTFAERIAHDQAHSRQWGGRTVFDDRAQRDDRPVTSATADDRSVATASRHESAAAAHVRRERTVAAPPAKPPRDAAQLSLFGRRRT
jgi:uncharacterized protein